MKIIKTVSLAAVAALVAMAIVGAAGASATVLCSKAPGAGACGNGVYPKGTTLKAKAEGVTFEGVGFGGTVTCKSSEASLKTTSAGGAGQPVLGQLTALNFSSCVGSPGCTIVAKGLPATASFSYAGENYGSLSLTSGATELGVSMSCGGVLSCTYGFGDPTLDFTGGSPATATINESPLNLTEGVCAEEAFLTAAYSVTSPAAVYLAAS